MYFPSFFSHFTLHLAKTEQDIYVQRMVFYVLYETLRLQGEENVITPTFLERLGRHMMLF